MAILLVVWLVYGHIIISIGSTHIVPVKLRVGHGYSNVPTCISNPTHLGLTYVPMSSTGPPDNATMAMFFQHVSRGQSISAASKEYAQEAIIKWLLYNSMFMVDVYFSC
jgi:hypothetical protein